MATGPGKYDHWVTKIREATLAEGVVLIVLNGVQGSGFSVQSVDNQLHPPVLADLLQHVVDTMRKDERPDGRPDGLDGE
jgi:negative regulator of sigma E activity